MASLSEIIQLCRLCLVKDHVNISIFDDPENVRQIPLKISSCLPVKISRDDNLPKKICDGCSSKLDLCYDFWTSTAQAEKTLLCMAKEKENQVPEAVIPQPLLLKVEPAEELLEETQICEPPVPKPIIVKKEVEPAPTSVENEAEEPAAKRPRRSAAIKAQMQIAPESDDDDAAEGLGTTEDVADVEDDIEDPDIPDMNVEIDDVKPGPSGLNQRSADSEYKWCCK